MEKKNLVIIVLAVLLVASGVGNIILGGFSGLFAAPEAKNILRNADSEAGAPAVLDPIDSWDSVSNDLIRHVCDTLWWYDLKKPEDIETATLSMKLAEGFEWKSGETELQIELKENIWFHDGSKFNATAVKFTIDRIMYFANYTGTLTGTHVADPGFLFYTFDNEPIINRTVINSEYNVSIFTNMPYGVLVPLLSYEACVILHPATTPANEYLELGQDTLVGTGPFRFVHYIAGEEVKFERNPLWWGSTNIYWDEIIWVYYPDTVTANQAMLAGDVDYLGGCLPSYITQFKANPETVFIDLGKSTIYRYWAFNNKKIPLAQRKALSYCYNYSYFLDVIEQNVSIRAHQMLPPGFPYYNESFQAAYYDPTIARQTLIDAYPTETAGLTAQDVGVNTTNDNAWKALELGSWDILQWEGSPWSADTVIQFQTDADLVGITLSPDLYDWPRYIDVSTDTPDDLEVWFTGWGPDYLDPYNMMAPLLSNESSANHIQFNDTLTYDYIRAYEAATTEGDKEYYVYKIHERAVLELYCHMPTSYDKVYYVHDKDLGNVAYNIMGSLYLAESYMMPS
ncbi:MAG: ABC transporter substrate-binding protein [Promethearchaeota archaeon]|nr:MAG: ABC transporter substrate-binding protein [Candidatus Lokiarchaeota archaeon]